MPRYRKLHVKTVESLDINDMPDDFTRLMWVLMPLGLCREGRGINNPAWIKSKLFPLRLDVTPERIADAMDWYESRGMLVRYEVDGRGYFHVPTFHRYQGSTTKEAESDYPPPPAQVVTNSEPTPELVQSKSSTDSICSIQYADALAPEKREKDTPAPKARNPDALDVFKQETGELLPDEYWAKEVDTTIGTSTADIERWRTVIRSWIGCGWSKRNVKGMLDYYRRNEIPGARANDSPAKTVPKPAQPTVLYQDLNETPTWLVPEPIEASS